MTLSKPAELDTPRVASSRRLNALIGKAKYQPPKVVSFPIDLTETAPASLAGNSGRVDFAPPSLAGNS
jgi:hypothetical protein